MCSSVKGRIIANYALFNQPINVTPGLCSIVTVLRSSCFLRSFTVSCKTTSESDILVHTQEGEKKLENTSAQCICPCLNVPSPPCCQDEWWVFTESDDGGSHCEEQHAGRVCRVMFHLRREKSKHHLRTTGDTPCTANATLRVKYLHSKCQRLSSSKRLLYPSTLLAIWKSVIQGSVCLTLSHFSVWAATRVELLVSPRQVAINSTKARHYPLSHTSPSAPYRRLVQTYNLEGERRVIVKEISSLTKWLFSFQMPRGESGEQACRLAVDKTWNHEQGLSSAGEKKHGGQSKMHGHLTLIDAALKCAGEVSCLFSFSTWLYIFFPPDI